MEINVIQKVQKVNDELAAVVRERLAAANVTACNMISAPGSGKTSLIEAFISSDSHGQKVGVIEGDPDTALDAERIQRLGAPVVQIMTSGGCHLESNLVLRALDQLPLSELDLLIIENVGNLVCPVEFDLGEGRRVAVVSVPEGHDKPAKYPKLFRMADVIILNKVDLLPHCAFDMDVFTGYLNKLNPNAPLIRASCTTGEGVDVWCEWLCSDVAKAGTS